jgi:hypothetical protein
MTGLEWRPVVGFEGLYEVSEDGRVRSLPRVVVDTLGRHQHRKGKEISPCWTGGDRGHLQVRLSREGSSTSYLLHHLVLQAFVGFPAQEGAKGLHRDDDPSNNYPNNLYWGTMQDNALDRVRNGKDANARKITCKRGHLLEAPNLNIGSGGQRNCRVCKLALGAARYQKNSDEGYIQSVADQKYDEIMAGVF